MQHATLGGVHATVAEYLDGLYEGDADKLAAIFDPQSSLTFLADGKVTVLPCAQWLANVRSRPKPKDAGLERKDRVLSVDLAGPDMAFVKVACQIPPRYFTDYLCLLRVDGKWRVAQKVYTTQPRP
ncbi:MAG: nuclear transport factor 2 family protein [Rhodospirillales bacterium]|nr:nuclear transport factor 2 family protein [Rhodospirillales bacterium]